MPQLFLNVSTALNKVLNPDKTTVLRSVSLVQGETYTVSLAFDATPTISSFAAYIRVHGSSANLVEVASVTAGNADYPYVFTLPLTSPTLADVLGSDDVADFRFFITYTEGDDLQQLEPFTARIINAGANGDDVDYVLSVNGLGGAVGITGKGITVTSEGSNVIIDSAKPYQTYATPTGSEVNTTLTAASPLLWLVDTTNNDANLVLPAAATVNGREYTVVKVDSSVHGVGIFVPVGQTMRNTPATSEGVAIYRQGSNASFLAAGGYWYFVGDAAC